MQNACENIKCDLEEFYILKTKLFTLEFLRRSQEKCVEFFEALINPCIPESVLCAFKRTINVDPSSYAIQDSNRSLDKLMYFLSQEIESKETIQSAHINLDAPQYLKAQSRCIGAIFWLYVRLSSI
ncbi:hypothetical protein NPIL_186061 [Nephila pilipes]|uniref:Uncharacterized protein n=1 Tax=Nephila pilipes TaxID=299642 RepID=A0A8X6MNI4_NEPPI|nr:hypothetical protein NPIL_186061 [Nephila pilipes]